MAVYTQESNSLLGSSTRKQSPEAYYDSISAYTRRKPSESIHCGLHYKDFAEFLSPGPRSTTPIASNASVQPPTSATGYPFITSLVYNKKGVTIGQPFEHTDPARLHDDLDEQQKKLHLQHPDTAQQDTATLLFMSGYPSPQWICALGAEFRVDPEFFRRHMSFCQVTDYNDQPCLPSGFLNILTLREVKLFHRENVISQDKVQQARAQSSDDVRSSHNNLQNLGDSIVRRFSPHNERTFSTEHNISCYIAKKPQGSWFNRHVCFQLDANTFKVTKLTPMALALVWMDSGREPVDNETKGTAGPPWVDSHTRLPIIQHFYKSALKYTASVPPPATTTPTASAAHGQHRPGPHPSQDRYIPANQQGTGQTNIQSNPRSAHLPNVYGLPSTTETPKTDPLGLLHDLYKYCLSGESQFINFLGQQVDESLRRASQDPEFALENLRYNKALLDDHIAYLSELECFTKAYHELSKDEIGTELHQTPATGARLTARYSILQDIASLTGRANRFSQRCLEGTAAIMNAAALLESRQAINQSEQVKLLTLLATVFIPASFVSSVFGMNFVEMDSGKSWSWAVGFGTIGAVILVSGLMSYWLEAKYKKKKEKVKMVSLLSSNVNG
ncbi:uncharacterized protein FSUBG_13973 [Fusarium subglutinans]|uniref:Uncharacterized protein n=1 Tax=Gibberella subglutinans TaxID=42677 RepID=A0A8H5KKQ9_GIBSU|nr:uncharacterized protein FSUBG_13973 [Fusarium subglutinans]KAF5575008.1 hypothetical protein FSUBG_13973 [Fusarium subglutinans]